MEMMGIGGTAAMAVAYKNKKADGAAAGRVRSSGSDKKKKKKLNYNYREISNQLMRTRTSLGARQVLSRAFQKVAVLHRQYRSGQYNEKEVERALMHAEAIAMVARKRMKHLQEEERAKRGGPCEAELEEDKEKVEFREEDMELEQPEQVELDSEEMKRLMAELEDALRDMQEESMEELEELTMTVQEDMDPADLDMLKKKHRAKELREIMEADMKYLKALFQELERERREGSSGSDSLSRPGDAADSGLSSVTLELSGMQKAVPATADVPAAAEGGSIDISL